MYWDLRRILLSLVVEVVRSAARRDTRLRRISAEEASSISVEKSRCDPNRLSPEQLAKLLSAAAQVQILSQQIQDDVEEGAPENADGTLNLVHYTAWLLKEMSAVQ